MDKLEIISNNEDYFDYLREILELREDEICILRRSHRNDRSV